MSPISIEMKRAIDKDFRYFLSMYFNASRSPVAYLWLIPLLRGWWVICEIRAIEGQLETGLY